MNFLLFRGLKALILVLLFSFHLTSFAQTFDWAKGIGGTSNDVATDVVSDANGNVYTVGYFYGTVDFDPGAAVFNLVSTGGRDVFISKMDATGNLAWAVKIGSTLDDIGNGIALDPSGNVLVTGGFFGGTDFDPGPGTVTLGNASGMDVFNLKLTNSGTYVWAKVFGGNSDTQIGNKITCDAAGNVYTTGQCIGAIDYDPGPGTAIIGASPSTNTNYFVSKLDANGNYVWARTIGTSSNAAYGMDISVSPTQEVYTCGYFISTVDFDPGAGTTTYNASSGTAAFVNKWDANGLFSWVKTIGTETLGNEAALSLVYKNGSVYSTGYFTGTCDFDQSASVMNITSFGGADIFIQALGSDGTLGWARQLGGAAEDWGYGLTVDAAGDIYTTGFYTGNTDFDPGAGSAPLTAVGLRDVFISKLNSSGNYIWGLSMGGAGTDTGYGIHVNGNGEVYTAGYYSASGDFNPTAGTTTLTNAGNNDLFIQKLGAQCLTPSAPVNLTAPNSPTICNGTSTTLATSGVGTIGWYTSSTGGTYLGGGSSYLTSNLTTTNTFYVQDSLCAAGARTPITVNVLTAINDLSLTAATSTLCNSGSTNIIVANSQSGVNYYLRNDATNMIIAGPVAGTGSNLSIPTGTINSTTTFNVIASLPSTNGAIDLDGINDYVDAGTNNRGITSTMTISARVRTTVNGASQFIASKYISASIGYYLYINAAGYASFQGRDVSGSIKTSGFSTTMVADNQWHEITGVVRSTGWEIWVDGVMQNSGSYTLGGTGLSTTASLLLGQFNGTYSPLDIDRFAIWNTALAPSVISSNATSCLVGNEANLTGYMPMNEGSGTIATDYSSTAINGTLTNMSVPACWILASSPLCSSDCQMEMSQLVTVTVSGPPATPTISAGGPTTFCSGGSVTLTSSSPTGNVWSSGETTQSIIVTAAGTYSVTVGSVGCSATSAGTTVTLNSLPTQPTISAGGATTFCAGGSVTLTSSVGTSYLWSNGATTASISPTTSGTYTVQVTNANGCQSVASAGTTVTVNSLPAQPSITPGGPTTFCQGGSVTLASSVGTSYLWSDGSMSPSINPSSTGTYTVQVTNAAGCLSVPSAPLTVTVNSLPNAPIISPNGATTFCSGGTVNLASSAGITYLWSNGSTNPSIDVTTSGTFTVQITGPNGCLSPASAPTTVTVNSSPTIFLGTVTNPTSCTNANGSIEVTGSGAGDLSWSGSSSGTMGGVLLSSTINGLNNGSYIITFTNPNGCSSNSLNVTLTAPAAPSAPTITAGGPTTFCEGGSVTLTSSNGVSYQWSTGETSASIVVSTDGNYTVSITDASGCSSPSSAAYTVTVNPLPVISIGTVTSPSTCTSIDGAFEVIGAGTGDLAWSGTATGSATGVTLPYTIGSLENGAYSVMFTDVNGCTSQSITSNVLSPSAPPAPTITAGGATTFCEGDFVTLYSSNGETYLWSTGETSQSIEVSTDGVYTVSITDASGCSSPSSSGTVVTVNPIPVATTSVSGITITATPAGASYQWIDCDGGNQLIVGETGQTFTPTANGNYAVIVTENGCSDTSECVAISEVGLNDLSSSFRLNAYPNPSTGIIHVECSQPIDAVKVLTLKGELVLESNSSTIDISSLARGMYLFEVHVMDQTGIIRVIKE